MRRQEDRTSDQRASRRPPGRPRRSEHQPLTREQVVQEALRLIDAAGAGALTMRTLAQRLGVEAMTLYAYVEGKDDLLNAVADVVAAEIVLDPPAGAGWQDRIRHAVSVWTESERRHPGAFPLLYRNRAGTENERAVTEELMDALAQAGFDPPGVALAYQTLISFLDGALLHWPRSRWHAPEIWPVVAAHVDANRYPRIAGTAPHAAQLSWEDVFFTGLELFLHGLEDRLPAAPMTERT